MKSNKKAYILNQKIDQEFNAAGKAMSDVFEVFTANGVKIMPGVPKSAPKFMKILDLPILIFYLLVVLGRGDYCIYSYPENKLKIRLMERFAKVRKVKVVCFINDINSIRDGHFDDPKVQELIREDMRYINAASIVLAPNENSKKFLKEQGIDAQIISVGTWDYIIHEDIPTKDEVKVDFQYPFKVAFAGNLNKAPFIHQLNEFQSDKVSFVLWGNCDRTVKESNNCTYKGSVAPQILVQEVESCDFGLVWDGISVHACEGGLGEYLQYNNSHKCGLYLAAGIPVFVWKNAGLADFVYKNQCGFAVENIDEMISILENLTCDEYQRILRNVQKVSRNIREGFYLKQALNRMYEL
ncbi:MAG: hypothetical protein ACI4AQ_03915 [Lachnospiraceae bacterium]